MQHVFSLLFAALLLLSGCNQNPETTEPKTTETLPDPHSFSRPDITSVTHLDLALAVDFETHQLSGSATWQLDSAHGTEFILDIYDINISQVLVDGEDVDFRLGEKDSLLGQALIILLKEKSAEVAISYTTSPDAAALQWLEPGQTSGKKLPFLFTQSQAILARTWIPCQDSPGVRYTYNATITVPAEMLAVMSATNPQTRNETGVYSFKMEIPIPSYLMALAVGDIAFKPVSERTGIYAEPDMLDKAAWEFAEMEDMVVAAEALYGPYVWGRYDVLVLPPSFPFGGMENPRLTFATPTVITGDRSLTSLIAHELAHSWSGNLVTNATWDDFWLNEGFTTYFEMRIMEAVYGRDYSEMIASISHQDMVNDIGKLMETDSLATSLKMDMRGRDPDGGVGAVAYDKGYEFLRLCEETVGRERFDIFLNSHFSRNKFKSMTTEAFLVQLREELLSQEEWDAINVDFWVYGLGIPANCPTPQSPRFAQVDAARSAFETGLKPSELQTKDWSTHEWVYFIRGLNNPSVQQLEALDNAFDFSASKNAEIMFAWMQPTILANYTGNGFQDHVNDFLINVGRRKFLTPTYRAMLAAGQETWALEVYGLARPNYHSVSRKTMDEVLDFHPDNKHL